ncbi:MAG: integrase [Methylotenera sp.]|nr:MAG: integrase [Methylotenera sp.]
MADIIIFQPQAEIDAAGNLRIFINLCQKELKVFGAELPFKEDTWDISDSINLNGHGNKRHRLVFSNLETVNDDSPISMAEPFLSFAKAYFRYMQGFRPVNGTGPRLVALRALEAALRESGGDADPIRSDLHIFNRAAQMIVEKYSAAAAYRQGGQLEMLSEFLCDNKLTTVSVRWRNFIMRPKDTVRVGKEFDERRNDKMPTQAALDALPEIFLRAVEPIDVIVSSVAALLCASPDRISEVLSLPHDCEVKQKNIKTGVEAYGLRWWPAKGAEPMIKWVVPSMASVVQVAITKISKITDESRRIAQWYESHPNQLYLSQSIEYLRLQEWLSMADLRSIFGFTQSNSALAWCKSNSIEVDKKLGKMYVRFSHVEKSIVKMLPVGFPIMDKNTGCKYSDALFVMRTYELGSQKATLNCMIESVSINQINTGLGGRVEHGHESIFSRFGYTEPDGSNINISTHIFRHYLNTLAQAGGVKPN